MISSKHINKIYVSTDSDYIRDLVARNYRDVAILDRPSNLAEDDVPSQAVFKHLAELLDFDILVNVQANSPQVETENIDAGIDLLLENNLWEVRSVSRNGLENGAFWILTKRAIFWDGLSVYFGVVNDDAIDIHTQEELDKVRGLIP